MRITGKRTPRSTRPLRVLHRMFVRLVRHGRKYTMYTFQQPGGLYDVACRWKKEESE